jgi:hypothetical protein
MVSKRIGIVLTIFFIFWLSEGASGQTQGKDSSQSSTDGFKSAGEVAKNHEQARESFIKKELKASSEAIRKAVENLGALEIRAARDREKAYLESIEGLRKLADRVEKGTVKSVKEIDMAFVQASHNLAQHHYIKGMSSWGRKEGVQTGQELRAAAIYLEEGIKWMGEKGKQEADAVVKDTHLLAGKLIEGAQITDQEAKKGFKVLKAEIDKLGKKVKPAQKK